MTRFMILTPVALAAALALGGCQSAMTSSAPTGDGASASARAATSQGAMTGADPLIASPAPPSSEDRPH